MKEEAIRKINKMGHAGQVIANICKVFVIIAAAFFLLGACFLLAMPEGAITASPAGSGNDRTAPSSGWANVSSLHSPLRQTVSAAQATDTAIAAAAHTDILFFIFNSPCSFALGPIPPGSRNCTIRRSASVRRPQETCYDSLGNHS